MMTPEQLAKERKAMRTPDELAEEYMRYENESTYWAKHAFLAGYEAAMKQPPDPLADVSKVMPDSCNHIVDVSKMVDLELHNEFYNYKHGHSFVAMAYVKHLEEVIIGRASEPPKEEG